MHPAQAKDSAAAVRWVYDNIDQYGGDNAKISISGHSAGAHLAALIGTDSKYLTEHNLAPTLFNAVIPADAASFDFNTPIVKGKRLVQPKIDATFGTNPQDLNEASPISHTKDNKDIPPFILFVTSKRPDAVEQTHAFSKAIKNSGGKSTVHIIDGKSHRAMAIAMSDPESTISKTIMEAIKN